MVTAWVGSLDLRYHGCLSVDPGGWPLFILGAIVVDGWLAISILDGELPASTCDLVTLVCDISKRVRQLLHYPHKVKYSLNLCVNLTSPWVIPKFGIYFPIECCILDVCCHLHCA